LEVLSVKQEASFLSSTSMQILQESLSQPHQEEDDEEVSNQLAILETEDILVNDISISHYLL
jgi:hypothetical protein